VTRVTAADPPLYQFRFPGRYVTLFAVDCANGIVRIFGSVTSSKIVKKVFRIVPLSR